MVDLSLVVLAVVVGCTWADGTGHLDLRMPSVQPRNRDTYLCFSTKLNDSALYITGFEPHAKKKTAHHILIYGCTTPGSNERIWDCGEMSTRSSDYTSGPTCATGGKIIYGWAMDAPSLNLPKDVAFKVGGDSDVKYLVLQVHYKDVTKFLPPRSERDSSGITLKTTEKALPKTAGIYLLGSNGVIPENTVEYMETVCNFDEPMEIHPFAFRTHTHTLGRVVSGYRIRDGQWTEIGRMDPRQPQMFYNATTPNLTVKPGDLLAARCTYENNLDHDVRIGATAADEMCNFYIMYYVDGNKLANRKYCFLSGPPSFYWQDWNEGDMNLEAMPETVSTTPEGESWQRGRYEDPDDMDEEWGAEQPVLDERNMDLLKYLLGMEEMREREAEELYDNY